jgi:hypothetical protein
MFLGLNSLFSDNISADDSPLRANRQAATSTVLLLKLETLLLDRR